MTVRCDSCNRTIGFTRPITSPAGYDYMDYRFTPNENYGGELDDGWFCFDCLEGETT